jgi:Tat protein secretion system quality control protein TatD with DNase activity
MQKVGLERLVLETDHEEASRVPQSMQEGIAFVAETFGVDARVVVERTTQNARDLYGLSQSDGLPSTL